MAPTGLSWTAATVPVLVDPSRLSDLTAWPGGFVALEWAQDDKRLTGIWRSTDGIAWERAPSPGRSTRDADLAVDGDSLVLGLRDRGARGTTVELWRSTDALTWTRAGRFTPRLPAGLAPPWHYAIGPLLASEGVLSYYTILSDETGMGGWAPVGPRLADAAVYALAVADTPDRNVVWTSRDGGRRWTDRPLVGAGTGSATRDLTITTDDGFLALRLGGMSTALIRSSDGIHWRKVVDLPDSYDWGGSEGLVSADGVVWLFSDDADPGTGFGNHLGAWRADADGSWDRLLDAQPAFTANQAAGDGWIVVVGSSKRADGMSWAWALVSSDEGLTWDPDLSWIGAPGSCAGEVVIRDSVAVLLGCQESQPVVWSAPLPSVLAPPSPMPSTAP